MPYVGRSTDKISNIEVLDNITFDGSSSYSITKGSVAFTPNSAQSLLISIDGVVQATNFTVSSSTIDFGVAIPSTSVCNFFLHYGTGVMTVPSDGSVTNAKLGSGSFSNITGVGTLSSGLTLSDNILFDTASKGIYLGTTSATASNLLDDYEEGTFTPSFSSGVSGSSYTRQAGKYTKIGNQCYFQIRIRGNGLGATTGHVRITGLPFAAASDEPYGGAIINYNVNFKGDGDFTCHKGGGDLTLYFYQNTGSDLLGTEADDINGELILNGFYRTA